MIFLPQSLFIYRTNDNDNDYNNVNEQGGRVRLMLPFVRSFICFVYQYECVKICVDIRTRYSISLSQEMFVSIPNEWV